jgi:hypothetical protein
VKLTPIIALVAVVAVPVTVQGAQEPAKAPPATKRICTIVPTIGSRVNNTRRCRTRDEAEAEKQEARQVVDKVQNLKVTMCPPYC